MMTVHEVSRRTGVSVRTLQYYDQIGLLHPAEYSQAGYRLYDETALEKMQQILLFRELEFPLKEIRNILDSPSFERDKALEQQITLLTMKKEHLEALIELAWNIKTKGAKDMDFSAFDTKKMEEYAAQAKAAWGETPAYHEFEEKSKGRTMNQQQDINTQMMGIFTEFGQLREGDPASEAAQNLVKKLQDFITEHFYTCTDEILASLGQMYAAGGEFTENIDKAGGAGTAEFSGKAIEIFTRR